MSQKLNKKLKISITYGRILNGTLRKKGRERCCAIGNQRNLFYCKGKEDRTSKDMPQIFKKNYCLCDSASIILREKNFPSCNSRLKHQACYFQQVFYI